MQSKKQTKIKTVGLGGGEGGRWEGGRWGGGRYRQSKAGAANAPLKWI